MNEADREKVAELARKGATFNREYREYAEGGFRCLDDTGKGSITLPDGQVISYSGGDVRSAMNDALRRLS